MTFLPVVERELRAAARRRGTWWFRFAAAGIALALGGWVLLIPMPRSPQALGQTLFAVFSVVALLYSLGSGLGTTADCLSEEKREGTLGLLFLTDLRGYDIVLGKLAATSLNAVYGLLALFPLMAIPLLAGGVSGAEFVRVVLVALNNLFFSLAVGLACSALGREERGTVSLAAGVIVFFTALLPLCAAVLSAWKNVKEPWLLWLLLPSPGFGGWSAFLGFTGFRSVWFYGSLACVHGLAWLALGLACWIVPRAWRDAAAADAEPAWRQGWRDLKYGESARRRGYRQAALEFNPFYWLATRERILGWMVWGFLLGMAGLWYWAWLKLQRDWLVAPTYLVTAFALHSMLKVWLASEAARRFALDRQSGALELLLVTPLSVAEILQGQWRALWKQFAAPAGVVLVLDTVFLLAERDEEYWVPVWLAGMVVFVADLIALSWLSMWLGLCQRRLNRAWNEAVLRVMALPWLLFALFVTLASGGTFFSGSDAGWVLLVFWLGISLAVAVVFGSYAKVSLLSEFRERATGRAGRLAAAGEPAGRKQPAG